MNGIIKNIIKTAPIEIDDNYEIRLRQRAEVLNKRRDKLIICNSRGSIEFENGIAVRFFPFVMYRKDFKRLDRMIKEINKELREIGKYL